MLDGVGAGLQSVAVPGLVARILNGTGRVNVGQGAVMTMQGLGASLSPALGGWIAQDLGYGVTFLVLGGFALVSVLLWVGFAATVKPACETQAPTRSASSPNAEFPARTQSERRAAGDRRDSKGKLECWN